MIVIRNLRKTFGNIVAVDDLTFTVQRGETLGFLGENGAGKTTTMRMLATFLAPTGGWATVNGFDVVSAAAQVRATLGYLAENAPAYDDMTVLSFLEFISAARKIYGNAAVNAIDKVINDCALNAVLTQTIGTLSKGFRRRVGLAQALLHNPPTLILDEPTDGLDPKQKRQVRELIKKIAAEKCILISTHILEEVTALCSRVLIIGKGRQLADAAPAELAARHGGTLEAAFHELT